MIYVLIFFIMLYRFIKYVIGFMILCFIQFICNKVVTAFHFFLPAPILGIIVLSFLIQMNIIKKEWIKDISNLLLKYMPMFFVPLFVGIIAYYSLIQKNLIFILISIIITTTLTLLLTAIFVENVIKFVRLKKIKELHND